MIYTTIRVTLDNILTKYIHYTLSELVPFKKIAHLCQCDSSSLYVHVMILIIFALNY